MPKRTVQMPSAEVLRRSFLYDPKTGSLLRKFATMRSAIGSEASYLNNIGYRQVVFFGRIYSVHRLAWVMNYGSTPDGEVDHINGDRSDNRISNLRLATSSQNNQNRSLSTRNKTGVKGVFRVKRGKPWRVSIGVNGKYHITQFDDFEEAKQYASDLRSKVHREFANTGEASPA